MYLAVAPHLHGSYSPLEHCCEGPWFTSIQEDGCDKGAHQSYLGTERNTPIIPNCFQSSQCCCCLCYPGEYVRLIRFIHTHTSHTHTNRNLRVQTTDCENKLTRSLSSIMTVFESRGLKKACGRLSEHNRRQLAPIVRDRMFIVQAKVSIFIYTSWLNIPQLAVN